MKLEDFEARKNLDYDGVPSITNEELDALLGVVRAGKAWVAFRGPRGQLGSPKAIYDARDAFDAALATVEALP